MRDVNIPKGWCLPNFDDVVLNVNGARKPVSLKIREGIKGEYPYYGATGQIDSLNDFTHEGEHILIGEDGANLLSKSKDLAFIVSGQFWVNNHAHAVKCMAGMPAKFIASYINSLDLSNWVSGSAQPKLTKGNLAKIPTVLPPLAEQKVIADKLDTLLTQVETTKARLERIPEILKTFRQSVLAAAVSGKLNAGDYQQAPVYKALGDVGVEVKTGPFGSALHKSEYISGGIPVINPMHISNGTIVASQQMTIPKAKYDELEAWHLKIGDVVVGRRGEMGRAAVVNYKGEMLCGTGSMILRTPKNSLPKYLEIILRSPLAVEYFTSNSVGSTMVNLNQKIIKSLQVHFPSQEEQTEIVRRVEKLFAYADKVEAQVKTAQARVNQLTQSILAKAFRGELTANWRAANPELISGENSAEALLVIIKNERAKLSQTKKGRGKSVEN